MGSYSDGKLEGLRLSLTILVWHLADLDSRSEAHKALSNLRGGLEDEIRKEYKARVSERKSELKWG